MVALVRGFFYGEERIRKTKENRRKITDAREKYDFIKLYRNAEQTEGKEKNTKRRKKKALKNATAVGVEWLF